MLKWISVSFVIAMLVLLPSARALAQTECPHPEPTIGALEECVAHAREMGHIDSEGIANSLLAKLDRAEDALDRGRAATAVNLLHAFIHEVEAQSGRHIDAEHAAHMVMHAESVITAISG